MQIFNIICIIRNRELSPFPGYHTAFCEPDHKMRKKIRQSEFGRLRRRHGINKKNAARWFEVTPRTISNWDRKGAPHWAMRLLFEREKQLSSFHPDWKGFKISSNGKLYGPNRLCMSAELLSHWPHLIRCLCGAVGPNYFKQD